MKTFTFYISAALLLLATVGGGLLHGDLTNRWGPPPDSSLAKERLGTPLPRQCGPWRLVRDAPLEPEVVRTLKCSAYISRLYEHEQTGNIVSVAVLLGPPGTISVHTPEICYSAINYSIAGERARTKVKDRNGMEHSLWEVDVQANQLTQPLLRVIYGWNAGSAWEATEQPRFQFGGLPHLYKIQVTSSLSKKAGPEINPGIDFLSHFLVELEPHLLPSRVVADSR